MDLPLPARRALPWVAPALALALYAVWEVHYRGVFGYSTSFYPIDDADEWRYTACSRLVERGYALFRDVFSAQPPLLFLSLASGMRLFGDSIVGARWVEIVFGSVSLLSCTWLAWLLEGYVAAGVAALVLAISPAFLLYSHTVEGEGPMMALMTLSLALSWAYHRTGRSSLAGFAGLALAAAVLMKLFALEAALPALWAIASSRRGRRPRVEAAAAFLAGLVIPVGLDFLLVFPQQQWEQVVRMHQRVAALSLPGTTPPIRLMTQFLAMDVGLSVLAAVGLIVLILQRRPYEAVFLTLWLPGSVLMLLIFHPLFPHHMAILLTGLAASAGAGIGAVAQRTFRRRDASTLAVIAGLGLYLALLPRLWQEDRHTLLAGGGPAVGTLSAYVRDHSTVSSFVVLDDLAVADRANRLVPPPLCDPSNVRLRAGYLSAADLIGSTVRYRSPLVLPSRGIFLQVPGYAVWLDRHYARRRAPDGKVAWLRT